MFVNFIEESFSLVPPFLQIFFSGVLGAVVGSFLSVICYRWPRGMSIVFPNSRSTDFKSPIPWHRNIPVFSYIYFGGRAEHTGRRYSPRYLVLEICSALIFLAIHQVYGWNIMLIYFWILAGILIAASFTDLELKIIPDNLTWGAWGFVLFLALIQSPIMPLTFSESLLGGFVGFGFFYAIMQAYYLVTGEDGMGYGDVKFMGFIGSALGWVAVLEVTIVGALVGLVVGLSLILIYRKGRRYAVPFGPFLAIGALAVILDVPIMELFFGASESLLGFFE